jgi:hypothetical protein
MEEATGTAISSALTLGRFLKIPHSPGRVSLLGDGSAKSYRKNSFSPMRIPWGYRGYNIDGARERRFR